MKRGFIVYVFLSLILILSLNVIVATCIDTDGGENYHEKGTINFGGQIVFEDYCFNDVFNTTTELKEGVCYGDGSWGELYYQCPNGCVNGACVNQDVNTKTCIETDGGRNYYTKGNVTEVWSNGGKVGYIDTCTDTNDEETASPVYQGPYLIERYCSGNEISAEFYRCPNGCVNGACVNQAVNTKTCIDTDGGENYHEKGTINFGGQIVFEDYCFNDVFNTTTELKEGVCYGDGSWGELYYQCPNGCVNGACVKESKSSQLQVRTSSEFGSTIRSGEGGTEAITEMKISQGADGKTYAELSNGIKTEVKVMPDTASEKALEVLGAKCEEMGCEIELKEVGKREEKKLVYEVKAKKEVKVLGFIKAHMRTQAQVDAETGEIVKIRNPWWGFLVKKE